MTDEELKQKARDVYIRCFDDDFKYTGVLHALETCAEEVAIEATKELQEEVKEWKINAECALKEQKMLENRIADLKKQNKKLQEENEQLKKLIADSRKDGMSPINAIIIKTLSEQIEEMKCCQNCKWYIQNICQLKWSLECLKTKNRWELAE